MQSEVLPKPKSRIRPRTRAKRCWELSFRIQRDDPTWTLVHGRLSTAPDMRDRSVVGWQHAWLERDGIVYDATLDASYTKDDYVAQFGATEEMRYTVKEAAVACIKAGGRVYEQWHDSDDRVGQARAIAETDR
jgi:hypothetical protein